MRQTREGKGDESKRQRKTEFFWWGGYTQQCPGLTPDCAFKDQSWWGLEII